MCRAFVLEYAGIHFICVLRLLSAMSTVGTTTANSQHRYDNDGDRLPAVVTYCKKKKIFTIRSLIISKYQIRHRNLTLLFMYPRTTMNTKSKAKSSPHLARPALSRCITHPHTPHVQRMQETGTRASRRRGCPHPQWSGRASRHPILVTSIQIATSRNRQYSWS